MPVDVSVPEGLRLRNPGRPLDCHVGEPLPAVNVYEMGAPAIGTIGRICGSVIDTAETWSEKL